MAGKLNGVASVMVVGAMLVTISGCQNLFDADDNDNDSQPATYTVTYDANGADSGTAPDDQTKIEGEDLTLATNSGNLTRTGYTFAGWNTAANGSGTDYAGGATYATDAALTLFAKWDADYQIGDTGPAGGVVFYDKGSYSDGWRYLEAWTADESETYWWKTSTSETTGTSTDVGSGYENTYSAMTGSEHPAAEVVRNATHGGYSDWFLPSKDELNGMYAQGEDIGGFDSAVYWSSSEYSANGAWSQFFGTGSQPVNNKFSEGGVRAARRF